MHLIDELMVLVVGMFLAVVDEEVGILLMVAVGNLELAVGNQLVVVVDSRHLLMCMAEVDHWSYLACLCLLRLMNV